MSLLTPGVQTNLDVGHSVGPPPWRPGGVGATEASVEHRNGLATCQSMSFRTASVVGVLGRPSKGSPRVRTGTAWPIVVALLITCAGSRPSWATESLSTPTLVDNPSPAAAPAPPLETPPLTLRVEGESPLPTTTLEEAVGQAVGRPVNVGEAGVHGTVTVSFEKDPATDVTHVRVVYQPPPEQLVRNDTLRADGSDVAHRIGELIQSLLRQDAGVTVVTPPPPPLPMTQSTTTSSPAAPSCPTHSYTPAQVPGYRSQPNPGSSGPRVKPWLLGAGLRWSPIGAGAATGTSEGGRLNDGFLLLGGSLQLMAPTTNRWRLGIEATIDHFDIESTLSDGRDGSLRGLYAAISAKASVTVLSRPNFDVNLNGSLGVVNMAEVTARGFTNSPLESAGDIGLRLGAALEATYWFSEHFGVNGALGIDQVTARLALPTSVETADGVTTAFSKDVQLWLKQPHVRVGLTYRF